MWRVALGVLICTTAQNCNVLQAITPSISLWSDATPYSTLKYINECPFPVSVFVFRESAIFEPNPAYVPALSTVYQRTSCNALITSTENITTSNGESTQLSVTCQKFVFPEVPLSGVNIYKFDVSVENSSEAELSYLSYPVAEVSNGKYTCAACTPSSSGGKAHKTAWARDMWSGFCDFMSSNDVPFLRMGKTKCPNSNDCGGLEDVRQNPGYTALPLIFDQQLVPVLYEVPFLNSELEPAILVTERPVVYFNAIFAAVPDVIPAIPTSQADSLVFALWIDYLDVAEVGFLIDEDNILTVQWSDLKATEDAKLTVQMIFKPNGDYGIRSGFCSGDFMRLLDNAVTGYQATDPSGQVMYDTQQIVDPCNVVLNCEMSNYRVDFVDQVVSDWIVPLDIVDFEARYEVYPVTYGTLVPPPQGEIQVAADGVVYQGTRVVAFQ